MNAEVWLPTVFILLMALSVLVYSILDGYDLGVGILLPNGEHQAGQRDTMIASIGPFWDANETWLVLAVGLLLIAFPTAHGEILMQLYLPATVMLIALILRGVAFDFRAKVELGQKYAWDITFKAGSLLTALSQGYMLGQYVVGFSRDTSALAFSLLSAVGVTAAYAYIGASWLVMKTEGQLQTRAIAWALWSGRAALLGVVAVSLVNIELNPEVLAKWFELPRAMFVLLIPLVCFTAFFVNDSLLRMPNTAAGSFSHLPFWLTTVVFVTCFLGLAFSFYPYIVPGKLTIWQAASATESLMFIFVGAAMVFPVIIAYTVYAYWVFRGKATKLQYY